MNKPQEAELTSEPLTLWSNNMKLSLPLCCLAAVITVSAGCKTLKPDGNSWNPLSAVSGSKEAQTDAEPASMAVVWKDSVYELPGKPSVKGFGGRFFIYDAHNNPIKAEGELVVYGYDESNPIHADGSNTGADKKFVFPSEKFQRHFSDSNLGASYSVWIPWEEVGGSRKSITLIPILKTASGKVLRCGHSLVVLPGRKPVSETANINGSKITNTPNLVAQASFQQVPAKLTNNGVTQASATTEITPPGGVMRTTTFNVPPALGKKLAAAQSLPTPTAKNAFPRPNEPAPSTHTGPRLPKPSAETAAAPATSPNATPKVFGMPGSF